MNKKYKELCENIVNLVGGKNNVSNFTHCVTRLRFTIKDKSLVDEKAINDYTCVLGINWAGEQLQVIIGQGVDDVYKSICENAGFEQQAAIDENLDAKKMDWSPKGILSALMDTISSILAPIIPAICGCGLIQGLLYSFESFGWVSADTEVFTFFLTCANAAFHFMPVIIAFSAGKRFKCNPYIAATLGAILIHPNFLGLAGTTVHVLGIPITYMDYSSTVIPVILCVYFMSKVEHLLKKFVPSMLDLIVTPFVSLALAAIVGLAVLAPLGNMAGNYIVSGFMWLYTTTGPIGGMLFSLCYPFILMTGMQIAEVPIMLQNFATLGYDVLYPCEAATNAAMAAVALYIFFVSKNEKNKALGSSTGITALIGVTEPVLFGLVLKYKKVLAAVMIGGGVGGFIMGLFKVKYLSFGFVPFGTIVLAVTDTFVYYLIGVFAAMIVAVIALHLLKFED